MAEWVSTRPIFNVCARETGYEGGGILRVMWWMYKVAEEQMRVTVEAILTATRVRRRQEYGSHDRSEGGSEGGAWTLRSRVVAVEYDYSGGLRWTW